MSASIAALPARLIPSSSLLTLCPPSAASRTETLRLFIGLRLRQLVDGADRHRLEGGQQLGDRHAVDAEGRGETEARSQVPAERRAGNGTQLAGDLQGEVPDLQPFQGLGRVQAVGAVGAGSAAGTAIGVALAEVPLGAGDKAFFSASSIRPRPT